MEQEPDSASYLEAKRKVHKLKAFYSNLGSFIIVNIMLIAINLLTSPDYLWFYWVTVVWGIFVIWNAVQLFSGTNVMGKDWEDRKIQEYMKKK